MVSYWIASILFFVFRHFMAPEYTPCAGGTMNTACLMDEQTSVYKVRENHFIFQAVIATLRN